MIQPPIITRLDIERFRGIRDLRLDDLSHVNVLVGANNCGKTSVLEAVKLMSDPSDVGLLIQLASYRATGIASSRRRKQIDRISSILPRSTGAQEETRYDTIQIGADIAGRSYDYGCVGTITHLTDITGDVSKALDLSVKYRVDDEKPSYLHHQIWDGRDTRFAPAENAVCSALFVPSHFNLYGAAVRYVSDQIIREGKSGILQMLRSFDEDIDDISVLDDEIYLHHKKSGSLQLFAYGSGLQKAAFLSSVVASCKDGVLLIDEIDDALNISMFRDVFRWSLDACLGHHVQTFVTTHSLDALDAMLRIVHRYHAGDDALRIITLRRDDRSVETRKIVRDGERAYRDRMAFGQELTL